MWKLIRPDAITALRDPLTLRLLPRYIKIVENKAIASFQILKSIGVERKEFGNLWELHDKLMKEFKEKKQEYEERISYENGYVKLIKPSLPKQVEPSLLDIKLMLAMETVKSCKLCEWKCGVNRLKGELGKCKAPSKLLISSEFIHLGEEAFFVPSYTVFFMGCNLHCQYCQNWTISQWFEKGNEITPERLSHLIELNKAKGCRNLNLVGGEPTPYLPWVIQTLKLCKANIPVVWNSNFYMSEICMKLLDGIVDVYLSDFKYGNDRCARRLSKVENYLEVCKRNHLRASEQTELVIRHLMLPNHFECCTKPVLEWIADNLRDKAIVNLMAQYRPEFLAYEYKEINRSLTSQEFEQAVKLAKQLGLNFIT